MEEGYLENIVIRLEEPKDYRIVEELTRAAFDVPPFIRPGREFPMEHHMVHKLREKDGIKELSFVAELDRKIVGHIIYSNAHVLCPDNSKIDVLTFGPISVLPALQKTGIGSALMKYSIAQAKKHGYGAIFFHGHADYYPRFGFVKANVFLGGEANPYCMAMELKEGYMKGIKGEFVEPDIYNDDLNREQAKEFDKQFHATYSR